MHGWLTKAGSFVQAVAPGRHLHTSHWLLTLWYRCPYKIETKNRLRLSDFDSVDSSITVLISDKIISQLDPLLVP